MGQDPAFWEVKVERVERGKDLSATSQMADKIWVYLVEAESSKENWVSNWENLA